MPMNFGQSQDQVIRQTSIPVVQNSHRQQRIPQRHHSVSEGVESRLMGVKSPSGYQSARYDHYKHFISALYVFSFFYAKLFKILKKLGNLRKLFGHFNQGIISNFSHKKMQYHGFNGVTHSIITLMNRWKLILWFGNFTSFALCLQIDIIHKCATLSLLTESSVPKKITNK